jgi:hypothetical protein
MSSVLLESGEVSLSATDSAALSVKGLRKGLPSPLIVRLLLILIADKEIMPEAMRGCLGLGGGAEQMLDDKEIIPVAARGCLGLGGADARL